MRPSSTTPSLGNQSTPTRSRESAPIREYRRPRNHLFPLEDYRAAIASGGTVRSYCGILEAVRRGNPAEVEEASEASADDCATCVDLWRDRRLVRM